MKKILVGLIMAIMFSTGFAYKPGDKVVLVTTANCPACVEAKKDLKAHNIPFTERAPKRGEFFVPQLYVNGKYKGTGSGAVNSYINE